MKWYQNKTIIILLLIFFFPVGLFLMWKYTDWDIKVKGIVSAAVAVVVVLVGIFYQPQTVPTNGNSSSTPSTSQTSSVGVEASSTNTSSNISSEQSTSSEAATSITTTSTTTSTPTITTTSSEVSKPNVTNIELVSVTSPVAKNKTARLEIKGTPNTEYAISVYYGSGASEAAGLENKIASASGTVVWEWKVGGSTKRGEHRIVISGGGAKLEAKFTTT